MPPPQFQSKFFVPEILYSIQHPIQVWKQMAVSWILVQNPRLILPVNIFQRQIQVKPIWKVRNTIFLVKKPGFSSFVRQFLNFPPLGILMPGLHEPGHQYRPDKNKCIRIMQLETHTHSNLYPIKR